MSREFVALAHGREHAVTVTSLDPATPGRYRVAIDGRDYDVDARRVRPGTWSLLVAEVADTGQAAAPRSHLVDIDARADRLAVTSGPLAIALALEDARRRRLAQAMSSGRSRGRGSGETIRAPIAGVVVAVSVAIGDAVEPGQPVGVLEAMKMENEIKAERGGEVTAIHVEPGQSVDTGDSLLTLA